MFFLTKLLLPIMIVVFPVASWGNSTTFEAKVVKIVDGDTITALDAQNTTIKIRMYGIDAPESKQAFGQKAKQALTTAIATKIVTVIDHGTDIGTVAKLAMRQPFVLFKGLTFQKLCLPGAFRPGDHHNKMLRPGLCVVHASPQYL
ncbi:thermonuclease family protein [Salmonella enterica]|nr:thermonuclease family protein [Salmonella enterica subsp. enterica serovar Derby]